MKENLGLKGGQKKMKRFVEYRKYERKEKTWMPNAKKEEQEIKIEWWQTKV